MDTQTKINLLFNFKVRTIEEREKIKKLLNDIKVYLALLENKKYETPDVIIRALEYYLESLKAKLQK